MGQPLQAADLGKAAGESACDRRVAAVASEDAVDGDAEGEAEACVEAGRLSEADAALLRVFWPARGEAWAERARLLAPAPPGRPQPMAERHCAVKRPRRRPSVQRQPPAEGAARQRRRTRQRGGPATAPLARLAGAAAQAGAVASAAGVTETAAPPAAEETAAVSGAAAGVGPAQEAPPHGVDLDSRGLRVNVPAGHALATKGLPGLLPDPKPFQAGRCAARVWRADAALPVFAQCRARRAPFCKQHVRAAAAREARALARSRGAGGRGPAAEEPLLRDARLRASVQGLFESGLLAPAELSACTSHFADEGA